MEFLVSTTLLRRIRRVSYDLVYRLYNGCTMVVLCSPPFDFRDAAVLGAFGTCHAPLDVAIEASVCKSRSALKSNTS